MYTEGFDQVIDESTTRTLTKEMAARREIRYLGLHQRVSSPCARSGAYAHPSLTALLRAKFKRCRVTAHSSASNDTSDIQPVALVLLISPIYLQKKLYIIVEWAKSV